MTSSSISVWRFLLSVQFKPRVLHRRQGGFELIIWHFICKNVSLHGTAGSKRNMN